MIDPADYTHRGLLWGIPVYVRDTFSHTPVIVGRNEFLDWMISWYVPSIQAVASLLNFLTRGEPLDGYPLEVTGAACDDEDIV